MPERAERRGRASTLTETIARREIALASRLVLARILTPSRYTLLGLLSSMSRLMAISRGDGTTEATAGRSRDTRGTRDAAGRDLRRRILRVIDHDDVFSAGNTRSARCRRQRASVRRRGRDGRPTIPSDGDVVWFFAVTTSFYRNRVKCFSRATYLRNVFEFTRYQRRP